MQGVPGKASTGSGHQTSSSNVSAMKGNKMYLGHEKLQKHNKCFLSGDHQQNHGGVGVDWVRREPGKSKCIRVCQKILFIFSFSFCM